MTKLWRSMTKLNILQKQMVERNLEWAYEKSIRSHRRYLRHQDPAWGPLPTTEEWTKATWVLNNRKHL